MFSTTHKSISLDTDNLLSNPHLPNTLEKSVLVIILYHEHVPN